jgi:hypothetical protein
MDMTERGVKDNLASFFGSWTCILSQNPSCGVVEDTETNRLS